MKTVAFQGEVSSDGKLRIEVPAELPPGPVEGVLVLQQAGPRPRPPYPSLKGILAGKLPDIDIDADLDEISTAWKRSLEPE